MYKRTGGERIYRAAYYEAGMEHTLNPQGITVNGKSRLTEALSRESQECEGEVQEAMGAPPSKAARPSQTNPLRPYQKVNVAPTCRILGNRIEVGRR